MQLEPMKKLTKDLRAATKLLSDAEARYLVDLYYQMQDDRKRTSNQVRAQGEEPCETLVHFNGAFEMLEGQVKKVLDIYTDEQPRGQWLKSVFGIGPVIAAGLLAHIDINRAKAPAAIWRLAGLDPTQVWGKGEKRPWNAQLKTLCWHAGQSFMKFSGKDGCYYGHLYKQHKEQIAARNEAGAYAEYAATRKDKVAKSTEAYKAYATGKLPPGQVDARARRFAVKRFLSDYFLVARWLEDGKVARLPWIIENGDSAVEHSYGLSPTLPEELQKALVVKLKEAGVSYYVG